MNTIAISYTSSPISPFKPAARSLPTKPETTNSTARPAVVVKAKTTPPAAAAKPDTASTLKPFAEVAREACATLDAAYKKTGRSAQDSWRSLTYQGAKDLGWDKLDRRTLFAIASNEGGLFSENESETADLKMGRLHTQAIAAARKAANAPFLSRRTSIAGTEGSIRFLEAAGPEEKASLGWAKERANSEALYVSITRHLPKTIPDDMKSDNQVVKLFIKAYAERSAIAQSLRKSSESNGTFDISAGNSALDDLFSRAGFAKMPSYIAAVALWEAQNNQQNKQKPVFSILL